MTRTTRRSFATALAAWFRRAADRPVLAIGIILLAWALTVALAIGVSAAIARLDPDPAPVLESEVVR